MNKLDSLLNYTRVPTALALAYFCGRDHAAGEMGGAVLCGVLAFIIGADIFARLVCDE